MYLLAALIFFGVMLNAVALVLLKMGMQRIGHFDFTAANIIPVGLQVATSLPIIAGMILYVVSVINWLAVISRMEISLAYPMMSIGYVMTALAGYVCFGEQLGPMRMAGIMVIMAGVWMISRTA